MISYFIHWSLQFTKELDSIYDYLYYSLASPQTAKKFYSKVKKLTSELDLFPERYSKVFISNNLPNHNLRKIPIDNYIIIYEVKHYSHEVFILHIFHGSQNYFDKL